MGEMHYETRSTYRATRHIPFWSKPVSILGLSNLTKVAAVHLR